MGSLWLYENKFKKFENLNNSISCDVCIIGSGIFGLTCAYYLSKNGMNCTIIDRDDICQKTTGHTTAKITSSHGLIYSYLAKNYGKDYAKNYLNANQEAISNIKDIIDNENINCEFEWQSNFVYTTDISEVVDIKKEVNCVKSLNFNANFITDCDLPFKISAGIEFPNQAQFNPAKYISGLINYCINHNVSIYTHTTAFDVKQEKSDLITITNSGKIHSKYVILASNYPFINFPGMYFLKMYKSLSYVVGIDVKKDLFDGMYITSSSPIYSFRTANFKGKKILLVGGLGHKTGYSTNINETYLNLENFVRTYYPKSEVLFRWNTCDCVTLDKIPYIGRFSKFIDNLYIGTGFNKWGMTSSNVAANIICDSIFKNNNKFSYIFNSNRLKLIKNRGEFKNIVSESINSLALKKIKKQNITLDDIKNDSGGIIDYHNKKIGIYKDSSRKYLCNKSNM